VQTKNKFTKTHLTWWGKEDSTPQGDEISVPEAETCGETGSRDWFEVANRSIVAVCNTDSIVVPCDAAGSAFICPGSLPGRRLRARAGCQWSHSKNRHYRPVFNPQPYVLDRAIVARSNYPRLGMPKQLTARRLPTRCGEKVPSISS
jgi:hypothetical protein